MITDSGPGDIDAEVTSCDVLMQTGCNAGEKCTWFEDDASDPPIGHIGCATTGTVAIGGTCNYGMPGTTGFDDCVSGSVCIHSPGMAGQCEAICDPQGAAPKCGAGFGCVRYSGLFGAVGSMTPSVAGVCEVACDPIADNDYDGSGAVSVRTGSACGSNAAVGCYGFASDTGDTTHFICAGPAAMTGTRDHRKVLATGEQYLNSCHPGYQIGLYYSDDSGSMTVVCYSWCKPGNSYGSKGDLGMFDPLPPAMQQPNGVTGNQCKIASGGRAGTFGTPAAANPVAVNGEHCAYSWMFEVDANDMLHRSPTSDTIGWCMDHTKYHYDPDAAGPMPVVPYDACAAMPLKSSTVLDATDVGCVDTMHAGFPAAAVGKAVPLHSTEKAKLARKQLREQFTMPGLDPAWGGSLPLAPKSQTVH